VLQSILCLNAIAGLGGLPQLSIPIGSGSTCHPIGLGVLAAAGEDPWLINNTQISIAA